VTDSELRITPHEHLTVRSSTPEALEVEARWAPNGSPPPKHFHPAQSEHFEVLAGRLRARVDGIDHDLGPGDELDIPGGTVHQMWNPGGEETRARWLTTPAGRTRQWFETLDAAQRSGKVGKNGMPGPLAFGVYLTEFRDVFRLAGPQPVHRVAFGALGLVGRLRGYRVGQ
jgi:quercetin dioxygenase-like cupin family protein